LFNIEPIGTVGFSCAMSYLVIDTEGNPDLKEIALVDSSGRVIYHAYSQEYAPDHPQPQPLAQIVTDLQHLAQNKLLIFHYADHDLEILKRAFKQARQPWLSNPVFCTWLAAKQYFPNLPSYSLEPQPTHADSLVAPYLSTGRKSPQATLVALC